ncbi:MAG: flagellin [Desulfovibrio sp.]|nr:flagellin [Desulfovibrio sp.]
MSLVVNNNLTAAHIGQNLNAHYTHLSSSTEHLSSGLRIYSAADDAAGLAIRELQRTDIAVFQQGARNCNDAVSMLQVADGALSIVDEKLIRMKELAEQAATGTYDSMQRMMIESEYQQMASEITRIANATDFNGIHLLNGFLSGAHNGSGIRESGRMKIHFGTGNDSAEDYYYVQIGNCTASAFGVGNQAHPASAAYTVSTQEAAQRALAGLNEAICSKDKIRADLGALQNRLENSITNVNIQAENLQAAESRISDEDVSVGMTEFVRQQILTQSAVAMMAQANSMPQMAMRLLE